MLANRDRGQRLGLCRALLAVLGLLGTAAPATAPPGRPCPACGAEQWLRVGDLPQEAVGAPAVPWPDTS